jgi:hypothetical protein
MTCLMIAAAMDNKLQPGPLASAEVAHPSWAHGMSQCASLHHSSSPHLLMLLSSTLRASLSPLLVSPGFLRMKPSMDHQVSRNLADQALFLRIHTPEGQAAAMACQRHIQGIEHAEMLLLLC